MRPASRQDAVLISPSPGQVAAPEGCRAAALALEPAAHASGFLTRSCRGGTTTTRRAVTPPPSRARDARAHREATIQASPVGGAGRRDSSVRIDTEGGFGAVGAGLVSSAELRFRDAVRSDDSTSRPDGVNDTTACSSADFSYGFKDTTTSSVAPPARRDSFCTALMRTTVAALRSGLKGSASVAVRRSQSGGRMSHNVTGRLAPRGLDGFQLAPVGADSASRLVAAAR